MLAGHAHPPELAVSFMPRSDETQAHHGSDDLTATASANQKLHPRDEGEKPLGVRFAWIPIPLLLFAMAIFSVLRQEKSIRRPRRFWP